MGNRSTIALNARNLRTGATATVTMLLLIFSSFVPKHAAAQSSTQAGELDSTFGAGGKVTTDFFGLNDQVQSLAIQTDGKIVAGGLATSPTTGSDFALARYNTDGSLDTSFGTNGKVTTDFFGGTDAITAIAIQPADGFIVAAGYAFSSTSVSSFALARYNTAGALDPAFGTGGKVTTSFSGSVDQGFGMALQTNGQIVVVGKAEFPTTMDDFALARYNSDGSLDTSFGTDGKLTTDFFGQDDTAFDLSIQSNGAIIATGEAVNSAQTEGDFALARYNSDGSLDSTFGSAGKVITNFFGSYDEALAAQLQTNGDIVAAGYSSTDATSFNFSASNNFALARYTSNGSLDPAFGTAGEVTTDVGTMDRIVSLAIQSNGDLVGGGLSFNSSSIMQFALARYTAAGALDTGFGNGGEVTTEFAGLGDKIIRIAIDGNGNILAGGSATEQKTGTDFAIARYIGASQTVTPPGFSMAFAQPSITLARGTKTTAQINITRVGGFTGDVTLSAPNPPVTGFKTPGLPVSISAGSGDVTIKVKTGAKVGSYQLIFTGTDSTGKLIQMATLTVSVAKK